MGRWTNRHDDLVISRGQVRAFTMRKAISNSTSLAPLSIEHNEFGRGPSTSFKRKNNRTHRMLTDAGRRSPEFCLAIAKPLRWKAYFSPGGSSPANQ